MKKRILLLLFIAFSFLPGSFAQQSESQLAFKYYRDKEFVKASSLFERLYTSTRSKSYFNYYIYCLVNLEQYSLAEKVIKKEIRKNPKDKTFLVELGYLYKLDNKTSKSQDRYQQALRQLLPVDRDIKDLANAFIGKREYDLALKTYEKGRTIRQQQHLYHFEIANIHLYQRNFDQMVEEFLVALSVDPSKLKQVESRLQSALFQDVNGDLDPLLRKKIIQRLQSKSPNPVFNELLLWYFIQKKEFAPALRQARALDLRLQEDGQRLLYLARMALANKDYENAFEAYQYIIEKGQQSENYLQSRIGALNVQLLKLEDKSSSSAPEIVNLDDQFEKFLKETQFRPSILPAILSFARLKAFHMDQVDESLELLKKASEIKGINSRHRTDIKMLHADVELLAGNPYEAILLYAQIEKSNKNNPYGYEAKLKKAKVAYYTGDLKWAQAQLDVLKGSTSKLIANDALALSQLISDNTSLDSTDVAMRKYAHADYLFFQNKKEKAIQVLDSLLQKFPGHTLQDEAHYKKFEIYSSINDKASALYSLNKIVDDHPYDILADKALFYRALLLESLDQKDKAMKSYRLIITDHPDSIYTIEARNRYRLLRGN